MMKKLLLLFLVFTLGISAQDVMHIDFDDNNPNIVFNSWNSSAGFAKITNPDVTEVNASAYVGQFTAGLSNWGQDNTIGIGIIDPTTVFTAPLNLSANAVFKMKIWSPEEVTITFHLENSPDWGNFIEVSDSVSSNELNQWVELTFDFSDEQNIFMNNIVIKVDGPSWTTDDFLFFDDISGAPMYDNPAYQYNPAANAVDISVGSSLAIITNDVFTAAQGATLSDVSSVVALRTNDSNGTDVPFTATINDSNNTITIDPINDLDYSSVYWYGVLENQVYHSDGSTVLGVQNTFTTKDPIIGDINEMLFDFDTVNQDLPFVSWSGTGFAKISNPDPTGINTSANVGEYTHAGNDSGLENDLVNGATPLSPPDFSETPYIKVKVWVDKPVDVTVRIQNFPNYGQGFDQTISVDQLNQWVQLVYNFGSVTANNYDRAQIYFDRWQEGGSVAGDVYYFDDYEKSNVAPVAELTYIPEDGASEVSLAAALAISSNLAFENLDGTNITDVSPYVSLRENDANGPLVPADITLSQTNTTIHITPSSLLDPNTTYWYGVSDNSIQFENGVSVTAAATFTTVESSNLVVLEDFDNITSSILYESMGEEDLDNLSVVVDPEDASNSVLQWDKGISWWGYERIHFELNAPFDLSDGMIFSVRVWSPVVTTMILKIADARGDEDMLSPFEITKAVNVANGWQVINFDFSEMGIAPTISTLKHLLLYIDGGNIETPRTYYFDTIQGPPLQTTNGLEDLQSSGFVIYPNPASDILYFKNVTPNTKVRIFDTNLRLIFSKNIPNNQMSIENLEKGLYFIQINDQLKRLIKN